MDKDMAVKILVDAFIFEQFNAEIRAKISKLKNNNSTEDCKDREVFLDYCLRKAWNDTIAYERYDPNSHLIHDSINDKKISELIREELKDELMKINKSQDKKDFFKKWHSKMCINNKYDMNCGLWQKFINMTFKYLYCFHCCGCNLTGIKESIYDECHMPLDSFTLNWYRRVCGIEEEIKWNKIKDYDCYIKIQKEIRDRVPKNYTVLQYEFIVWSIENLRKSKKEYRDLAESAFFSKLLLYRLMRDDTDMLLNGVKDPDNLNDLITACNKILSLN